ncbi:hypothetical protein G9464_17540 [Halostella sp. JP-L12]|uniref:hypothetical protein n=1 Tax=Halostella TaxID=1843185 RepID=UPI0013CEAC3B|nr:MULTISPECIES: hypothetical protein [Halostella]NHN49377.1 hypothetical protein [Halostella sp. JP-L12]
MKPLAMALAAGFAAFVVVGVAVTELALPWIEFSLFLGLPVGLVAGVSVAAAVYVGLSEDARGQHRRIAVATTGFGVVFLAVLILATVAVQRSVVSSLVLAVGAGMATAVLTYVWLGRSSRRGNHRR